MTNPGRIWLSPPDVRDREREMLFAALDSGWVAPVGPDLDSFENELAEQCGTARAVALSSGTAALHLALLLAGVGPEDEVVMPTLTFVATANAVTYCGAHPRFIDSEPSTWNLSPQLLYEELNERRRVGRLPAAVITVDLYGQCADHHAILPLCEELEIPVIEDAAEAIGATWAGRPAGSFGHFGVLSFNGNKLITTSSGGALLTDDHDAADRAAYLATQARQPSVHYEHTEVGFNYRLSNLLAAFGRGQLATLDERIERRRKIRACYQDALTTAPGVAFAPEDRRGNANAWLTCVTVDPEKAGCTTTELQDHLRARDIESRPIWKPMHAQPLYAASPARLDGTADGLFATGLCLPSGSSLSDDELDRVIAALRERLALK